MEENRTHSGSHRGYRRKSHGSGRSSQSRPAKLNRLFALYGGIAGGIMLLLVAFAIGRNTASSGGVMDPGAQTSGVPAAAVTSAATQEIYETLDTALRMRKEGNIDEAAALIGPLVESGHIPARLLLAELHMDQLDYAGAAALIAQGVPGLANAADAHLLRARLLGLGGNQPTAFVEYQSAANLEPLDANIHLQWGRALRDFGRSKEAMQRFHEALRRADSAAQRFTIQTLILMSRAEQEDAVNVRAEAAPHVEAKLPSPSWQIALAVVALRENQIDEAVKWLNEARSRLPAELFREILADPVFQPHLNSAPFQRLRE